MRFKLFLTSALLSGLLLGAFKAEAQDAGDAPKPAMSGGSSDLQGDNLQDTPDTRPLSGAQFLSLGSVSANHSFLVPSFGVTSAVQVNPYLSSQPGAPPLISTTYVSGRLGVNKISERSELLIDYLTSGGFSNFANTANSSVQSLDFAETIHFGRWSHMFGEQFTYLPESSFNFGGLSGLNNLGVNLGSVGSTPGFRQDILPNQTIVTNGARISNSAIAQTTYALGYRSSLTFGGVYSRLDFLGNGLQNSSMASGSAGYNYLLSPLNSMSVSYGYSRVILANSPFGIENHNVQLSFARRVTARMSFQMSGGPNALLFRASVAGPSSRVGWLASTALNYQWQRVTAGFTYSHSVGGGAGVLPGAETDAFSGQLGRTLGNFKASIFAGYSRNQGFGQTLTRNAIAPQGWFVTAQASRQFPRNGSLFVSFDVSGQSALATLCSLPACRVNTLTQTISLGYNWGLRPILLQ